MQLSGRRPWSPASGAVGVSLTSSHARFALHGRIVNEFALPSGVVVRGEIVDPLALAQALRAGLVEHGRRPVRAALPSARTVTRTIWVDAGLDGDALAAAVTAGVAELVPTSVEQLVLGHSELERDAERRRLLVVAAPRDQVLHLHGAITATKASDCAIEAAGPIVACAAPGPGITLVVDAGRMTTMAVSEAGRCGFARTAQAGIDALAETIVQRHGLTTEAALHHVRAAWTGDTADLDAGLISLVRDEMSYMALAIAAEARSSLEFYERGDGAGTVASVLVLGDAAGWPGLTDALQGELGRPVEVSTLGSDHVAAALSERGLVGLPVPAGATRRPKGAWTPRAAALGATLLAATAVGTAVAANRVEDRKATLHLSAERSATLQEQRDALAPYGQLADRRTALETSARTALGRRFAWDDALAGVAAAARGTVLLTGLRATLDTGTLLDTSGQPNTLRTARPGPAIEIGGCGPRNRAVSEFLTRLRQQDGVIDVALDASRRRAAADVSCPGTRQFSVIAYYDGTPPALTAVATVPTTTEAGG